jgi:hypothetical protein
MRGCSKPFVAVNLITSMPSAKEHHSHSGGICHRFSTLIIRINFKYQISVQGIAWLDPFGFCVPQS